MSDANELTHEEMAASAADFMEEAADVALQALPGLLAAGQEPVTAALNSYLAAKAFLMDGPKFLVQLCEAEYGGIPMLKPRPADPEEHGV